MAEYIYVNSCFFTVTIFKWHDARLNSYVLWQNNSSSKPRNAFFWYLSFEQIIEMVSELKQNLFLAPSFRTTSGIQFNMNCLMSVGTEKKLCQTLVLEPKCSLPYLINISARCSDIINLCFIKDLGCFSAKHFYCQYPGTKLFHFYITTCTIPLLPLDHYIAIFTFPQDSTGM